MRVNPQSWHHGAAARKPLAPHSANTRDAGQTADKPIAAVCHGAQLLAAAGILQGRECSAYPACGPDVRMAGGTYIDIPADQVHVQGNLVTAPAWPSHPRWLAAFVKVLGARIEL